MELVFNRLAIGESTATKRNQIRNEMIGPGRQNRRGYADQPMPVHRLARFTQGSTAALLRNPALVEAAGPEAPMPARTGRPVVTGLAFLTFALIAMGGIGNYFAPHSLLALGMPVGFTSWALLAWWLNRHSA